jgi:hypothetical protein
VRAAVPLAPRRARFWPRAELACKSAPRNGRSPPPKIIFDTMMRRTKLARHFCFVKKFKYLMPLFGFEKLFSRTP